VLQRLGVQDVLAKRVSTHASGAAAMQALAASRDASPIGCTQVSEILDTRGVRLVGPLPPEFELVTLYAAAVCTRAADAAAAMRFVERITGPGSAALRARCGFEPTAP